MAALSDNTLQRVAADERAKLQALLGQLQKSSQVLRTHYKKLVEFVAADGLGLDDTRADAVAKAFRDVAESVKGCVQADGELHTLQALVYDISTQEEDLGDLSVYVEDYMAAQREALAPQMKAAFDKERAMLLDALKKGTEETETAGGEIPLEVRLKCPIMKIYMKDPVRSNVCKHSFSREGIMALAKKGSCRCPVAGCKKEIRITDLEDDVDLKILADTPAGRRLFEAAAAEDDDE